MYLDTAVVGKLFFTEPESDQAQAMVRQETEVYSSELLIVEFHSLVARKSRETGMPRSVAIRILAAFTQLVEDGALRLVPVTGKEIRRGGEMIMKIGDRVALRSLDAIHLTTCRDYALFPLVTNDRVMLQAAASLRIPARPLASD